MSNLSDLRKTGLGLVTAILVALVITPTIGWTCGHVVHVPPPNGVDDTMEIQAALDECVERGPVCTVQLAAGTYFTSQVVVHNFRGVFKGWGRNRTIIEALPNLPVNVPPDDPNPFTTPPNTTDSLWPDLFIFVDGDVTVSDVMFKISAIPATQTWGFWGWEFHEALSAVRFQMTEQPMDVSIKRITVEGLSDENSSWGYNLINCIIIAGEHPKPGIVGDWRHDHYVFSGNVSIVENQFKGCVSSDAVAHAKDSRVRIGGNISENVGYAVELANVEGSVVDISHNRGDAQWAGAILYNPYFPPDKPTRFTIRRNRFKSVGPAAEGILLVDNQGENKVQNAIIANNLIEAQGIGFGAIHAVSTRGTQIWGNLISGSGTAGLWIEGGTMCSLVGNRVSNFSPGPDHARIVLDADTSECLVVGKYDEGDVLDLGRNNNIVDWHGPH